MAGSQEHPDPERPVHHTHLRYCWPGDRADHHRRCHQQYTGCLPDLDAEQYAGDACHAVGRKKIKVEQYDYDERNRLVSYVVIGSRLSRDGYDHEITEQRYQYDALNNLTIVTTTLLHILADREHSFWRNVNAVSGFA